MSKEYRFCYHGTKEMLFHQCNQCRYINEYIISTLGGKIEFGIERAGHSGGYWYTPNIIEYEDKIELVGTIQYIGPQSDQNSHSKLSKLKDKIITVLLFIIFGPVALLTYLIIKLIDFVKWLSAKISKKEKKMNPKTKEEKLNDLMINHLGCSKVENTPC